MDLLPVFMKLNQNKCLVVGSSLMVFHKIKLLREAGAEISLLSLDSPCEEIKQLLDEGSIKSVDASLKEIEVQGYSLIVVSTDDDEKDQLIVKKANSFNIPINVIDRPELCSFLFPSIVDRSPLIIAVSSCGKSPTLSRFIRKKISDLFPDDYGKLATAIGEYRIKMKPLLKNYNEKKDFWKNLIFHSSMVENYVHGNKKVLHEQMEKELLKHKK